jgi:hypothetical protein
MKKHPDHKPVPFADNKILTCCRARTAHKWCIASIIVLGICCLFGLLPIVNTRNSEAEKTANEDQLLKLKDFYQFRLRYRENYEKCIKESGFVVNLPKFEIIDINTATKVELENAIEEEFARMSELRSEYGYTLHRTPIDR